jgi:hypothetical protein
MGVAVVVVMGLYGWRVFLNGFNTVGLIVVVVVVVVVVDWNAETMLLLPTSSSTSITSSSDDTVPVMLCEVIFLYCV